MSIPLSPIELHKTKIKQIPDVVIDAINHLLAVNSGNSCTITIKHKDIERKIKETHSGSIPSYWYDFEPLYNELGWSVVYDGPSYGESYDPYFTFKPLPRG